MPYKFKVFFLTFIREKDVEALETDENRFRIQLQAYI
jgi:hypothetical protein